MSNSGKKNDRSSSQKKVRSSQHSLVRSSEHERVRSMTAFSAAEGTIGSVPVKMEIKALNHRYLDVKIRLPREFSSAEIPLRSLVQSSFSRGSIDVRLERQSQTGDTQASTLKVNQPLARAYVQALRELQREFGLSEAIQIRDLATYPDLIVSGSKELSAEEIWTALEPIAKDAFSKLTSMREHEGQALTQVLLKVSDELSAALLMLRQRRDENTGLMQERIREKVTSVFEAYPLAEKSVQSVLESRVAQELALILDRTDIEEELSRFEGHLDHYRKILGDGGVVGRKLDFILQEMNREVNTLANKAQDYLSSEEAVQIKVKLEQLREQVLNIE